jgi:hypothetical protein
MRTCAHVYTLNYDVALETALDETNVPWTTGFETYHLPQRHGDHLRWKRGQVGFFNPSALDDPSIRVKILKLHGSHRWAVATGGAEGGFSSASVVELSPSLYARALRDAINVKKPLRLKVTLPVGKDAVSDFFLEFGPGRLGGAASFGLTHRTTTPLLILADENKARWSQPYRELHSRFDLSLIASGVLIVIGYGWGDVYLNERIGEAFLRGAGEGLMAIISVSRSEPPISRLFPPGLYLDAKWLVDRRISAVHSPRMMFWVKGSTAVALRGEPCEVFTAQVHGGTTRFDGPVEMTLQDGPDPNRWTG